MMVVPRIVKSKKNGNNVPLETKQLIFSGRCSNIALNYSISNSIASLSVLLGVMFFASAEILCGLFEEP